MELLRADVLSQMLDELAERGWTTHRELLAPELCLGLAARARELARDGDLRPAGIGRGQGRQELSKIRGDSICWIEDHTQHPWEQQFLTAMAELRDSLRRELYVPVSSYEAHFAQYEPGRAYAKHYDRFRDADEREFSTVLFLNPEWQEQDAGALNLYDPHEDDRVMASILPRCGQFVLFQSAKIPHEVLAPRRTRYSIAGWMRRAS